MTIILMMINHHDNNNQNQEINPFASFIALSQMPGRRRRPALLALPAHVPPSLAQPCLDEQNGPDAYTSASFPAHPQNTARPSTYVHPTTGA